MFMREVKRVYTNGLFWNQSSGVRWTHVIWSEPIIKAPPQAPFVEHVLPERGDSDSLSLIHRIES